MLTGINGDLISGMKNQWTISLAKGGFCEGSSYTNSSLPHSSPKDSSQGSNLKYKYRD